MVDPALAGLATVAAGWSLLRVVADPRWIGPFVAAAVAVVAAGSIGRSRAWGAAPTAGAQAAAAALVTCWLLLPDHTWLGLPRPSAMSAAARLLEDGAWTARRHVAPLAATDGVVLLLIAALIGLAIAVHAVAVSYESPALAGVPLAVVCLAAAPNDGGPLPAAFFLAPAAAWLLMLGHGTSRPGEAPVSRGRGRMGAVWLAGAVTVAATAVPLLAPQVPRSTPTAVAAATGGTFTGSLDLAADLPDRSQAPILRVHADEAEPPPLKVAGSTRFVDGRWLVGPTRGVDEFAPTPPPAGAEEHTLEVTRNALPRPRLALPEPLAGADVPAGWGVDSLGVARVQDPVTTYTATYYAYGSTLPAGVGRPGAPSEVGPDLLAVDEEARDRVTKLATDLAGDATNQVDRAMAIQQHLRSPAYTYSRELADPGPGNPDPLTSFLDSRQGYCVQFATAMVMLARALDIPARLAVGFAIGDVGSDGVHTVVLADSHAWPELYINGLGWTRFEPTPGVGGDVPLYYVPAGGDDPGPVPGSRATAPPTETVPDAAAAPTEAAARAAGSTAALGFGVAVVGAGAVVAAAVLHRRRRPVEPDADRIEREWRRLVADLGDLGVPALAASATPRQAGGQYGPTVGTASGALGRVVATVERSRYHPGGAAAGDVGADVRAVVDQVRRAAPWRARARVRLWPSRRAGALRGVFLSPRARRR
ncbi:transglutaminase-like domain-containing protein [Georgenia yuyongxinii]|uniref:transglutaminase-like domain-containing protein n=1 Tax=Georgenia yuyongxinii TaxID=2589797 RepID=UPI00143DDA7A|nr:transglutaminase-like domain-containing protein [Georgenia yuyongxinii]